MTSKHYLQDRQLREEVIQFIGYGTIIKSVVIDTSRKEYMGLVDQFVSDSIADSLTDEELTVAIKEIVAEVGATSPKDMGKVMGAASSKLAGKAEGKLISAKVKDILASL